jgi:hypothetical protein
MAHEIWLEGMDSARTVFWLAGMQSNWTKSVQSVMVHPAESGNKVRCNRIGNRRFPTKTVLFSSYSGALAIKSSSYSVRLDCQCLGSEVPRLEFFYT